MSIWEELLTFIRRPDLAAFEPLALRVFRHQFQTVAYYRAYCLERGISRPEIVDSVDAIPALSTIAFKYVTLSGEPAERVFATSGTTVGASERGRHHVPHLEIYRASAMEHLRRMLFPDRTRIRVLTLHPTADLMPESSLAQMISWCIEEFGNGRTRCVANRQSVAFGEARNFLADSAAAGEPVCILGTTAALAALFSSFVESGRPTRMPAGSRIMDTGGAKGQATPLSAEDLRAAALQWLGIEAPLVINEYGMTEMCSQLYDLTPFNCGATESSGRWRAARARGLRPKLGPPWMRASAVDPVTFARLPDGEIGLLSFFDLANAGSISALVTEDLGIVEGNAVFVLGRAAGDARGCALAIEQFAAAEGTAPAARRVVEPGPAERVPIAPQPVLVTSVAGELREFLRVTLPPDRIAVALAETCRRWRDRSFAARRETLSLAARASGFSPAMLDESLDALLDPFHAAAFEALAARLAPRPQLLGFVMPGNVLGAGLHEVCHALLGGAAIMLKTSTAEPRFFPAFARTLCAVEAQVGARVAVLNWGRDDFARTAALKRVCDRIVAFGDDETMTALAGAHLIAFGSRASGALLGSDSAREAAPAIARDVSLFEQRGCLSPHHVFVADDSDGPIACDFARELAQALEELAVHIPPPARLSMPDAAAIRSVRENARWRKLAGIGVEMWEGQALGWTVIYDPRASFRLSPGYRTVYVSPVRDLDDFRDRLEPAAGRLEAFAIADRAGSLAPARAALTAIGVSYLAAPGAMQSPPLNWRHGGGALLDLFLAARSEP
jgi:acyl-CoA reductase LuxC/acyl-protein synthetase LuxE